MRARENVEEIRYVVNHWASLLNRFALMSLAPPLPYLKCWSSISPRWVRC